MPAHLHQAARARAEGKTTGLGWKSAQWFVLNQKGLRKSPLAWGLGAPPVFSSLDFQSCSGRLASRLFYPHLSLSPWHWNLEALHSSPTLSEGWTSTAGRAGLPKPPQVASEVGCLLSSGCWTSPYGWSQAGWLWIRRTPWSCRPSPARQVGFRRNWWPSTVGMQLQLPPECLTN
jgi:hypothetical protein